MKTLFFILLFSTSAIAAHLHLEKEYQAAWCTEHGGIAEYRLDDGTRVDCLTEEYAVEFDFAPKWAESVGQSLYYGSMTGKKPGVVLIMEKEGDERYLKRLKVLADRTGFKIWTMIPSSLTLKSNANL